MENIRITSTDTPRKLDIGSVEHNSNMSVNISRPDSKPFSFLDEPEENENENENFDLSYLANEKKILDDDDDAGTRKDEMSETGSNEFLMDDHYDNEDHHNIPFEEIQQQKAYYISQLKRLEKRGLHASRRYTMDHNLDDIRSEVQRIKQEIAIDSAIETARNTLITVATGIEHTNAYLGWGFELSGWSRFVAGDVQQSKYDAILEELYEKYKNTLSVSPEFKLLFMFGGSALMFHINKKITDNPNVLGSVLNAFGNLNNPMQQQTRPQQSQPTMRGPNNDIRDFLNSNDDASSVSSRSTQSDSFMKNTRRIPIKTNVGGPKRRGRPPKNKT